MNILELNNDILGMIKGELMIARTHQKKKELNRELYNTPREYKVLDIFYNLRQLGILFRDAEGFYSHYNLGAGQYRCDVCHFNPKKREECCVKNDKDCHIPLVCGLCLKLITLDNNVDTPSKLTLRIDDEYDDY